MKIILEASSNPSECRKIAHKIHSELFESVGANEIDDTLSQVLENYLQHAPVERTDLANACNVINRLKKYVFNLECLYRLQTDGPRAVLVEDVKPCTAN